MPLTLKRSSASQIEAERRRYPRFETNEWVEVEGPEGSAGGVIRDICSGGACILTGSRRRVGDRLVVRGPFGEMAASVAHAAEVPTGHLIGVAFDRAIRLPEEGGEFVWPARW